MAGLFILPDEVTGAISEFLRENGINNTVLTQHDPPAIYIQRLQLLLRIRDNALKVERIVDVDTHDDLDTDVLASIDLTHPDSLSLLLEVLQPLLA